MYWEQRVEYAALSDIGFRRRNNQDSYAVCMAGSREQWGERGHLFLVADGMGGHAVGELASKIAADTIPHTYHKLGEQSSEEALKAAVLAGNAAINARGEMNRDFTRMGTTCSTLVLGPRGALVAHVGDSRVYRIRGDRIEQLTFDHSLQWELLRQGLLSPEEVYRFEPRNVITRSLGPAATVQVDMEGPYPARPGDVYVLCSDGLSGLVRDEEIGVVAKELPPPEACRLLVDLANLRGGPDNITVLVVRVGPIPPQFPPEDDVAEDWHSDRTAIDWWQLIGAFVAAVLFIAGQTFLLLGRPLAGFAVEALGIVGFGALLLHWLRRRRMALDGSDFRRRGPGTPYRTALARLTPAFVTELANLEYNLQRSAVEEGWSIDWGQHGSVFQAAKTALAEQRYGEALRDFAGAIHTLITGIHLLRKQRDQLARWGAKPVAAREDLGDVGGTANGK
ncbi:MAG: PP2C family protein-serine/threonine phosphatase [Planctomycetaceae bacterium]